MNKYIFSAILIFGILILSSVESKSQVVDVSVNPSCDCVANIVLLSQVLLSYTLLAGPIAYCLVSLILSPTPSTI